MKIDDVHLEEEWNEHNDIVYQCTQRYITAITKKTDDAIRKQIYEYAKLKSEEYGEEVGVLLIDEEKVNRIIDLGLKEYLRETRGCEWRRKD